MARRDTALQDSIRPFRRRAYIRRLFRVLRWLFVVMMLVLISALLYWAIGAFV